MAWQMKEARLRNKMTIEEARAKLGVSQPTLNAWEAGRKAPSIDSLENMANLYGVTTDFLLGRPEAISQDSNQPINNQLLLVMDGMPVWSERHGWILVNAADHQLRLPSGGTVPFADAGDLYISSRALGAVVPPFEDPLKKSDLVHQTEVWVEPISSDAYLRNELRGWYRISNGFAENSTGNRFTLDSYGAKWLAFTK